MPLISFCDAVSEDKDQNTGELVKSSFFSILSGRKKKKIRLLSPGFPCGSAGKESACNAGDLGSIPGLGRSPEEGKGYHSSILAWRTPWTFIVPGVTKSRIQLSDFHFLNPYQLLSNCCCHEIIDNF